MNQVHKTERDLLRDRLNYHLERLGLHRLLLTNLLEHVDAGTDTSIISKQLDMTLRFIGPERNLTFEKGTPYVYVLSLEDDCWYVGLSQSLSDRISAHFTGSGAQWTRIHRPRHVHSITPGGKDLEKETTLDFMRSKGWQFVRGSAWCSVNMSKPPQCV